MSDMNDAILAALVEKCPECENGWNADCHDYHVAGRKLSERGEVLAELLAKYIRCELRPDARGGWESR